VGPTAGDAIATFETFFGGIDEEECPGDRLRAVTVRVVVERAKVAQPITPGLAVLGED